MQLAATPLFPIRAVVVQLTPFDKVGTSPQPAPQHQRGGGWYTSGSREGTPLAGSGHCWRPHATTGHHLMLPLLLLTARPIIAVRCSSRNAPQRSKPALTLDTPAWWGGRRQRPSSSFFFPHFFPISVNSWCPPTQRLRFKTSLRSQCAGAKMQELSPKGSPWLAEAQLPEESRDVNLTVCPSLPQV